MKRQACSLRHPLQLQELRESRTRQLSDESRDPQSSVEALRQDTVDQQSVKLSYDPNKCVSLFIFI